MRMTSPANSTAVAIAEPVDPLAGMNGDNWLDGLNPQETRFVLEYLRTLSPQTAALRAEYAKSTASSWAYIWANGRGDPALGPAKTKPHVYRAIQFGLRLQGEETLTTIHRLVRENARIAFSDIRNVVRFRAHKIVERDEENPDPNNPDVVTTREIVTNQIEIIPSDELDDDTAAAIREVRQDADGNVTVKMHEKGPALERLGRMYGLADIGVRLKGADGSALPAGTNTAKAAMLAYQAMLEEE